MIYAGTNGSSGTEGMFDLIVTLIHQSIPDQSMNEDGLIARRWRPKMMT
jgi:hypothetical protein